MARFTIFPSIVDFVGVKKFLFLVRACWNETLKISNNADYIISGRGEIVDIVLLFFFILRNSHLESFLTHHNARPDAASMEGKPGRTSHTTYVDRIYIF